MDKMNFQEDNKIKGIIYMIISAFCLAIMSALIKALSANLPTIEMVFFRNIFGVIIILMSLYKIPVKQKGGKFFLLFFRGIIGFTAMISYFYNITHIPLADAVTYSRTSPIFTAIFAMIFLKESIGVKGWISIGLGFLGMLLVMQPSGGFSKEHIFGFVNAICAALAFTSIRELRKYYDTRMIVLSFMGIGLIMPIIFMIISEFYYIDNLDFILGNFIMPKENEWIYLLGIGIFSFLGQIYMTKAYGETKAGIVGAAGYFVIVFSIVLGLFLGDNLPNILAFIGIFLIISGGILNAKK